MRKSLMQKVLIAGTLTAAAASAPLLAGAQVYVRVGPPPRVVERRPPPPRPGYVWHAGYQRWDGARYVWVPGEYVAPPRPHAVWIDGRWVHGPRGWYYRDGRWR